MTFFFFFWRNYFEAFFIFFFWMGNQIAIKFAIHFFFFFFRGKNYFAKKFKCKIFSLDKFSWRINWRCKKGVLKFSSSYLLRLIANRRQSLLRDIWGRKLHGWLISAMKCSKLQFNSRFEISHLTLCIHIENVHLILVTNVNWIQMQIFAKDSTSFLIFLSRSFGYLWVTHKKNSEQRPI